MPPLLSVVICTLNEHEAIARVLNELTGLLGAAAYEIIVVDDSPDERTGDVVRRCASQNASIRLLRRHGSRGLSTAAIAGWDIAKGKYLAIMDGDGQHDPLLISRMLELLRQRPVDLVVASRYMENGQSGLQGFRHMVSRGGIWFTDRMLGMPLADPLSGCFMMTREWYAEVRPQLSGLGFKILIDVLASSRCKPRIQQLPTLLRTRLGGKSKLDMHIAIELVLLLIEKRTHGRMTARRLGLWAGGAAMLLLVLFIAGLALHLGCSFLPAFALALIALIGSAEWLTRQRRLTPQHAKDLQHNEPLRKRLALIFVGVALAIGLRMAGAPWELSMLSGCLPAEYAYYLRLSA